jgi:16S rRNA (cytosine967-C5)-methyltransferase
MPITELQLDATVRALATVLPMRGPADSALSYFFREHKNLGPKDRAFIAEAVFGVLRRKRYLEAVAEDTRPRHLLLAWLVKVQGLPLRELEPCIHGGEIAWIKQAKAVTTDNLPPAVQADLPDWLYEKLCAFLPEEDVLKLARSVQQPAPLDLRANTLLINRDEVLAILQSENIPAEATPYSPIGIRVKGKPAINRHYLFTTGKVEVQDEGSQLLGYLLAPKRSDMVVDFCAGAGGKTLMLGAMMNSQGRLYALDVSDKRLNNLKPRLKRSGLSNVHPQLIAHENDTKIKRLAGKIDRVLVDSPCSGLGTLRRNPELKWRQTPESIAELTVKQRAILEGAAKLVKAGGRLVYATCSILPEENEEIVEAFLSAHPEFELLNSADLLAKQQIRLDTGKYLKLSPQLHGTDAFFAAAMQKKTPQQGEPVPTISSTSPETSPEI